MKDLSNIKCCFPIISGNVYHVYEKEYSYFSLIHPREWNYAPPSFIGKYSGSYLYDYDKTFKLVSTYYSNET